MFLSEHDGKAIPYKWMGRQVHKSNGRTIKRLQCINIIRSLESKGLISVARSMPGHRSRRNVYKIIPLDPLLDYTFSIRGVCVNIRGKGGIVFYELLYLVRKLGMMIGDESLKLWLMVKKLCQRLTPTTQALHTALTSVIPKLCRSTDREHRLIEDRLAYAYVALRNALGEAA